jgi:hypothetical protein
MKLTSHFASLALVASLALAVPMPHNRLSKKDCQEGPSGMMMATNSTGSSNSTAAVGAAFFLSNDPTGNAIIVNTIAQDGTLVSADLTIKVSAYRAP